MKKVLTILSFLFLVLLAIPAAQAQATLTQTYTTADGSFSIMYPTGWTVSAPASSVTPTSMQLQFNSGSTNVLDPDHAPLVSGEMGVLLLVSHTPISVVLPPDQWIEILSAQFGSSTSAPTIEDLTVGSYQAARAVLTSPGQDTEMISVDFGNGTNVTALGITFKSELAKLDATMLAMLATAPSGSSASTTGQTTAAATTSPAATTAPPPTLAATSVPTTTISLQPKALWTDDALGFASSGLVFSADDKSLLVGNRVEGEPNTTDIALVDAATGKQLKTLSGLQQAPNQVAISPDGTTIAGSDNTSLLVWDAASGAVKTTIQTQQYEQMEDLAYNPKTGALLYITQGNPKDTLWQLDLATGQPEALYVIDRNNPLAGLAISPDGSSALVGVKDESDVAHVHATVYQIDLTSHNATKIFDQPDVEQIALLYPAQGQPLIAVNPEGTYTTQVWDITGNKLLYTLPEAKTKDGDTVGTTLVAINPAGTILVTSSISVEAQLWNAKTGAPIVTLDRNLKDMQNSEPYGFAFSSDGNWLAVTYGNNKVVLWSLDGSGAPATSGGTTSPTVAPTATTAASGTTTTIPASACSVTTSKGANLRTGPGTTFARAGALAAGVSQSVSGQANGSDSFVWWKLDSGSWVRSDLVQTAGDCTSVPTAAS